MLNICFTLILNTAVDRLARTEQTRGVNTGRYGENMLNVPQDLLYVC